MKKKNVFKQLSCYLKPYRLRLFFSLLFAAASTIFMVMAPFMIGRITTTLFDSIEDGVFYTGIFCIIRKCNRKGTFYKIDT